jgi:cytochrome c556
MKKIGHLFFVLLGVAVVNPVFAHSKDPKINAIKARQGEMYVRAHNLGPLVAMAKGKTPYDSALAAKLAGNLKLLLELDTSRDWPQGTDNKTYPKKTTALPNIWTTYPEIEEYAKKYAGAVNELNSAASESLEALQSKIGAVGNACKGCHDEYQAEH